MSIEAFPLHWPVGWKRTKNQSTSGFQVQSFGRVRDELYRELRLMGAKSVVLSSNVSLRLDGIPRAGQPEPSDSGVAVYFTHKGKSISMACDRWKKVGDNVRALQKSIDAIRGIDRWGCSEFLDRSFTGFEALPEAGKKEWWEVLSVPKGSGPNTVRNKYRELARAAHPDLNGGDGAWMAEINQAFSYWEQNVN